MAPPTGRFSAVLLAAVLTSAAACTSDPAPPVTTAPVTTAPVTTAPVTTAPVTTAPTEEPAGFFPDPRVNELVAAAQASDADLVAALRADGVAIDARGNGGITPLMYLADRGGTAAVRLLIRAGADTRLGDDRGEPCWSGWPSPRTT